MTTRKKKGISFSYYGRALITYQWRTTVRHYPDESECFCQRRPSRPLYRGVSTDTDHGSIYFFPPPCIFHFTCSVVTCTVDSRKAGEACLRYIEAFWTTDEPSVTDHQRWMAVPFLLFYFFKVFRLFSVLYLFLFLVYFHMIGSSFDTHRSALIQTRHQVIQDRWLCCRGSSLHAPARIFFFLHEVLAEWTPLRIEEGQGTVGGDPRTKAPSHNGM